MEYRAILKESTVPGLILSLLAISMTAFQIYTAATIVFDPSIQRGIHLGFALLITFLLYSWTGKKEKLVHFSIGAIILASLSGLASLYVLLNWEDLSVPYRTASPILLDFVFGFLTILLVLEGTRRVIGYSLPIIAGSFLLYGFAGKYLPGMLSHPGFSMSRLIAQVYLLPEGIFGIPLGVSATYVFIFVLYGAFLRELGGGDFFTDLAFSLFGRVRGGPAKMAVVASALFGTISGSGVVNVATTGQFTIPLMKRVGYAPHFAGAVEATASIGGQIMPPVMGAGAFVMAELLVIPYGKICLAAAIPAVIYFFTVFMVVDFEAAKTGLRGFAKEDLPKFIPVLKKGWHFLFSPLLLLYLLAVYELSPMRAGFWSIVIMVSIDLVQRTLAKQSLQWDRIVRACRQGAYDSLVIATATACVGIIIGIITLTALGSKLSNALILLSQGQLLPLLFLTMIASIILGMGVPTVAAYLILALIAGPILIKVGVDPLAAHLFIFYFGIMAGITPPVALDAYVGAGIAGADPLKTGFTAMRLGVAAFLLPYVFVYNQAILMRGPALQVFLASLSGVIGGLCLASGVQGFLLYRLTLWQRACTIIGGLSLVHVGLRTDLIGYSLLGLVLIPQAVKRYSESKVSKKLFGEVDNL